MPEKILQEGISGQLTQWIQKPAYIPGVVVLVPIKANTTCKGNMCLHQAQQWPFGIIHTWTSVRPQEVISFQVFSRNVKDSLSLLRQSHQIQTETVMAQTVSSEVRNSVAIFGWLAWNTQIMSVGKGSSVL